MKKPKKKAKKLVSASQWINIGISRDKKQKLTIFVNGKKIGVAPDKSTFSFWVKYKK